MAEPSLTINLVTDIKPIKLPYNSTMTAEDACISICKFLSIGTIARHLFALRITGKTIFLMPSAQFLNKNCQYDFRLRYKVASIEKLGKIDAKAYDYYFHQVRNDVLENKISDIIYEKYRRELLGLGITDMYRVMLEKDIPRESVENDYKKYIPKEVLRRHAFFIKKPIHDSLGKLQKSVHDAKYVKAEYLKQLDTIAPEYLSEMYKAVTDQDGVVSNINIKVSPYHPTEPGLRYVPEDKKDWKRICTIEEMGFVSKRSDGTVEISRKNGIPFYFKFTSPSLMLSFISLLDGYYRLTCKWTFNICKDVPTPSLHKLYAMKCHGPVGGEFSYAKLQEKRSNRPGCFIIRESEVKYNHYYIDVCMKDSLKPKTFKLERITGDEFIFNDDVTKFRSIQQLMAEYNDPNGVIYLQECLPPSEYDQSPLLLCQNENLPGDSLTDYSSLGIITPSSPLCINCKELQVYKDRNCLKWNKNRLKVKEWGKFVPYDKFNKIKYPEEDLGKAKKYCRNPDGDLGGPWCFIENENTDEIEKEYCDIPFCDEPDCEVFTKNFATYTHYIDFNETLTNMSFGLKLWNSDSFLNTSAKLVLALLPLPLKGEGVQKSGVGLEIFISNRGSTLKFGNKDKKPDYEDTPGILTSTKYTMFSVTWSAPFISLFLEGELKPIFLAEYRTKNNLLGFKKNKFNYYTAQGNNVLWYFPFCMDDFECDVHTTTGPFYQQFRPLRVNSVGQDLQFYLRAFHSVNIIFVASPTSDYPNIIISLERSKQLTRVTANLYNTSSVILKELSLSNLLDYWEWREFSFSFFADTLQFYWAKSVGASLIFELHHDVFRRMRWFSCSSDFTVAHWTFFCSPPEVAKPPPAFPPECALDEEERNYKGTQDVTSEGYPCLPWSAKKILPSEASYETKTTLQAWSYCRDPMQENKGTYCYIFSSVDEKKVEKRFCRLRKCKSQECRMAGTGNDYVGSVNITRSNRSCEFWFGKHPRHPIDRNYHNVTLYPDLRPEQDALNYCRNPSRNLAGQKREGSRSITMVYRSMWKVTRGKKVEVAMKVLKEESCDRYLKSFLDLAGQYAFLQSAAIVRLFGITLSSNVSMVMEYFRLGPLDRYMREHKGILKVVDLIEASSNLASALWHLKENNIVHGNIRCRKLMVNMHDENSFTVKLTDPGIHVLYASKEVHWIPVECYSNLDYARHSTAADVWAFATTLWEIFTFGGEIRSTDHLDNMRLYVSGKRLPQPAVCPNDIYQLMRECWDADPHRRKQPQAVMRDINQILYQVYNSRRTHSYAKVFAKSNSALQNIAAASTNSLCSNSTEATFIPYSDVLVPVSEMSAPSSFRSEPQNWISNSQELINNEDAISADFSNVLSGFSFPITASLDSINSMQSIFELDDNCNVVLQGRIGQGFYGEVYRGTMEFWGEESRKVAVKKLKSTALSSGLEDFEREINIMKTLEHPNIVEILGVLREPEICLVMEYVQHGSLQSYLKIYRETLNTKQLLKYASDIANGMDYLGIKNIVHRDLATRNILVVDEDHVKISDFGLAQVTGTNDYYILRTSRELPIKWYAPESLRDGKFSVRSDVWSYGVTLCEMFNCGEEPQLTNMEEKSVGQEQQMLLNALESGARFPCPAMCPQAVYIRIIYPCWQANPHARPRFSELVDETEDLLTQY